MIWISSGCIFAAVFLAVQSFATVWDSFSQRYVADLIPMMRSLSIDQTSSRLYFRLWGVVLVGTFLMLGPVLKMFPIALAATYLVWSMPRLILNSLIGKRRVLLRDQMVSASVALANTSRAGLSLADGMQVVGDELPQPLQREFQEINSAYKYGRPLAESIRAIGSRLNVDSFTLFSSALLTCLERGGRVTEALERISHSLAEMQRVERKIESDTASGRKVVWVLTAFPFLFLGFSNYANPAGTDDVMNTLVGQLILLVVIGMTWASFRWSQKIMDIEV